MKIDAIVGNPPYQILDGGNNASAMPVYQHFVNVARLLRSSYISMIMPSRWTVSGRGLDDFRKSMLDDSHLSKLFDFKNGSDCFPGIRIGGGVCYLLWDINKNDSKVEITNMPRIESNPPQIRPVKEFGLDFLIRDNTVRSIINKVFNHKEKKMSSLAFSQKPFGFRTNFKAFNSHGDVKIYTKKENIGYAYVNRNDVEKNRQYIDEWQVVTSRSTSVPEEDNGQVLRAVQTFICEPGAVVTESYVVVASFKNAYEAKNCLKYLKTKFFRLLCQVTIVSPDVSVRTFELVPQQDFTKSSDIRWEMSIDEIEQQLFDKYALTENEREFIRLQIKAIS